MAPPYVTIKLPKELMDVIDEIVEKKELGFVSRAEFVKEAVRRLYLEYFPKAHKESH
jgi:metal-responsive CopG/Arc/MetJ family transcriptional regulator